MDSAMSHLVICPDGSLSSRTFYLGAMLRVYSEDVQVVSRDNVFFYVHAVQLLAESDNFFGTTLVFPFGLSQHISVTETSSVFDLLLHAIYNISCTHYDPTDGDIISAVHALHKYGIPPARLMGSSTTLFQVIVSRLPHRDAATALLFYALSGQYDLRDLAVHCSQFLLPLRLSDIFGVLAVQMGAVYLKHLLFLRRKRVKKLQELLSPPPPAHLPIPQCKPERQAALVRAWRLIGAYFIWNGGADLTPVALEVRFSMLKDELTCGMCKAALGNHLRSVVDAWSRVERTISFDNQSNTFLFDAGAPERTVAETNSLYPF